MLYCLGTLLANPPLLNNNYAQMLHTPMLALEVLISTSVNMDGFVGLVCLGLYWRREGEMLSPKVSICPSNVLDECEVFHEFPGF